MASNLLEKLSEDPRAAKKAVAEALSNVGSDKERVVGNEGYADYLVSLAEKNARVSKLFATVERRLNALDTENLTNPMGDVTAFGPLLRSVAEVSTLLHVSTIRAKWSA